MERKRLSHKLKSFFLFLILLFSFITVFNLTIPMAKATTYTLRPNAAGTYQQWSTFGAPPSHWQGTSDISDTTGVQAPTANTTAKETENLDDSESTNPVNSITVYVRAKAFGSGGSERIVIVWRTYSTNYESSPLTISRSGFANYLDFKASNPNTSGAWNYTELNNLEVGVRASTLAATEYVQVAEIWIVVDQAPPYKFTIINNIDDAEEVGTTWNTGRNWVQVISHPTEASKSYGGLLFDNVFIPEPVTINSANLSVYIFSTAYDDANLDVYGHDVNNAPVFGKGEGIVNRSRTTATFSWVQNSIGTGWQVKDVTTIVQEIVNRPGWASGNNMSFLWIPRADATKSLYFRSREGAVDYRAKLEVTYTQLPEVPEELMNSFGSNVYSDRGNAIYYSGITPAIYYGVLNFNTTKYVAKAYNISTQTWTNSINVTTAPISDTHWIPSISVLPNGSIIMFYGYAAYIRYKITTGSAKTEKNQTTLLSSWSSEFNATNLLDTNAYPHAISYDDSLLLFYRNGTAIGGEWDYKTFNGSVWSSQTTLISAGTTGFNTSYWYISRFKNYTLLSGFRYTTGYEDALFLYSPDQGVTWKYYNGTTASLPVSPASAVVYNTPIGFEFRGAILDENNKVSFMGKGGWWKTDPSGTLDVNLVYYSLPIGQSGGTWYWRNVTNTNNVQLKGTASALFYDYYYQQPSFYFVNITGFPNNYSAQSNVTRYMRYESSNQTKFTLIANTSSQDVTFWFWGQGIVDAIAGSFYNVVTQEFERNMLGLDSTSANKINITQQRVYATNFTATKTSMIDAITLHVERPASWYDPVNVAIYSSSGASKLTEGDGWTGTTEALGAYNNWITIPLDSPVSITSGTAYWIAMNGVHYPASEYMYIYNASGSSGQTRYVNRNYTDGFPSNITTYTGTLNTKIAAFGVRTLIRTRGSQLDESMPALQNMSETIDAGETTLITLESKWFSPYYMSKAMFYWNYSGTMTYNGSYTYPDYTPQGWANLTRTIETPIVLGWYVIANDTTGELSISGTRTVNIGKDVTFVNTASPSPLSTLDIGEEKLSALVNLVTILTQFSLTLERIFATSQSISITGLLEMGREILQTLTETPQAQSILSFGKETLSTFLTTIQTQADFILGIERQFISSQIATVTTLMEFAKETFGELTVTITQTITPQDMLVQTQEIILSFTETPQAQIILSWGKEAIWQLLETITSTPTMTLLKETITQITMTIVETTQVTGILIYTFETVISPVYVTLAQAYNIAFAVGGIGIVALAIALIKTRRKREGGEEQD